MSLYNGLKTVDFDVCPLLDVTYLYYNNCFMLHAILLSALYVETPLTNVTI